MKHILKQLEELVTNLKLSEFRKAVVSLTLYYTAGVFVILIAFSFLVYGLFATRYDSNFRDIVHTETNETVGSEIKENLSEILIISDLVLLILSVFVSYALSRKTLAPLEEIHQKQKRFIANAAHELRTPLAVIKAGGQVILQKERTVTEYKKFAQELLHETNRLITLSNDLLLLAQSTIRTNQHFEVFSLSKTCAKECNQIIPYTQVKNIIVKTNIQDNVKISGKQSDIERLILNLLKNAVDYNIERGVITVILVEKDKKAFLSIKDSGIGISPKDIPYIFEPFYKADVARTHKKHSRTGLGLAIAKEIMDEHGGTITVESTLGKGSCFKVTLPSI